MHGHTHVLRLFFDNFKDAQKFYSLFRGILMGELVTIEDELGTGYPVVVTRHKTEDPVDDAWPLQCSRLPDVLAASVTSVDPDTDTVSHVFAVKGETISKTSVPVKPWLERKYCWAVPEPELPVAAALTARDESGNGVVFYGTRAELTTLKHALIEDVKEKARDFAELATKKLNDVRKRLGEELGIPAAVVAAGLAINTRFLNVEKKTDDKSLKRMDLSVPVEFVLLSRAVSAPVEITYGVSGSVIKVHGIKTVLTPSGIHDVIEHAKKTGIHARENGVHHLVTEAAEKLTQTFLQMFRGYWLLRQKEQNKSQEEGPSQHS